ncbi:hypothetical protein HDU90_008269 [Geranomyces variabilis]|nr:hypothetical protein HDU90_008269 [Geranomyces variabilis]
MSLSSEIWQEIGSYLYAQNVRPRQIPAQAFLPGILSQLLEGQRARTDLYLIDELLAESGFLLSTGVYELEEAEKIPGWPPRPISAQNPGDAYIVVLPFRFVEAPVPAGAAAVQPMYNQLVNAILRHGIWFPELVDAVTAQLFLNGVPGAPNVRQMQRARLRNVSWIFNGVIPSPSLNCWMERNITVADQNVAIRALSARHEIRMDRGFNPTTWVTSGNSIHVTNLILGQQALVNLSPAAMGAALPLPAFIGLVAVHLYDGGDNDAIAAAQQFLRIMPASVLTLGVTVGVFSADQPLRQVIRSSGVTHIEVLLRNSGDRGDHLLGAIPWGIVSVKHVSIPGTRLRNANQLLTHGRFSLCTAFSIHIESQHNYNVTKLRDFVARLHAALPAIHQPANCANLPVEIVVWDADDSVDLNELAAIVSTYFERAVYTGFEFDIQ